MQLTNILSFIHSFIHDCKCMSAHKQTDVVLCAPGVMETEAVDLVISFDNRGEHVIVPSPEFTAYFPVPFGSLHVGPFCSELVCAVSLIMESVDNIHFVEMLTPYMIRDGYFRGQNPLTSKLSYPYKVCSSKWRDCAGVETLGYALCRMVDHGMSPWMARTVWISSTAPNRREVSETVAKSILSSRWRWSSADAGLEALGAMVSLNVCSPTPVRKRKKRMQGQLGMYLRGVGIAGLSNDAIWNVVFRTRDMSMRLLRMAIPVHRDNIHMFIDDCEPHHTPIIEYLASEHLPRVAVHLQAKTIMPFFKPTKGTSLFMILKWVTDSKNVRVMGEHRARVEGSAQRHPDFKFAPIVPDVKHRGMLKFLDTLHSMHNARRDFAGDVMGLMGVFCPLPNRRGVLQPPAILDSEVPVQWGMWKEGFVNQVVLDIFAVCLGCATWTRTQTKNPPPRRNRWFSCFKKEKKNKGSAWSKSERARGIMKAFEMVDLLAVWDEVIHCEIEACEDHLNM